jgi:hypothetical protein
MRAKTKQLAVLLLLPLAMPTAAAAAEIYGRIYRGSSPTDRTPLPAGIRVTLSTTPQTAYTTTTRANGAYSLSVSEQGKFRLAVQYGNQTPSLFVTSSNNPAEYNLRLQQQEGRWVIVQDPR